MAFLVFGILGCDGDSAGTRQPGASSNWELTLLPPAPLEQAEAVLAFEITGDPKSPLPIDPILVEGEPSDVSVEHYTLGQTTEVLAGRIVPTFSQQNPGKLLIRPRFSLALGQRYTLLSRSGVLGVVAVRPSFERTYLSRVWPPRDSVEATLQLIYCGEDAPRDREVVALFPAEVSASVELGLDATSRAASNCIRILPNGSDGALAQPPILIGDFALEPAPFRVGMELPELAPLVCGASAYPLGPGCLRLSNGNALVEGPAGTTFWVIASSFGWHSVAIEGGGRFVLPLVQSATTGRLDAWVFDLAGRSISASVGIAALEPVPHVVINEVMANPLGTEPAEEWVELVNAGTASATMVGWRLRDQAGEVELPAILLEPGAFALLVRQDFAGGQAGDVPPAPGTTLLRLASLGKNGITNSGEALGLLDEKGTVVSQFPARASGQPGTSWARRTPLELDDSVQGFGPHASPGGSPGTPNAVE